MKEKHYPVSRIAAAAVTAAFIIGSAAVPVAAASGVSCTVNGKTITLPAAAIQTINMEQSTVLDVNLQSSSALPFHTADSKKLEISVKKPFNSGSSTYSIYALGSVNSSVGVYANNDSSSKLFIVNITVRPFDSDTTMAVNIPSGNSYTFRITPQNTNDYVTFYTTDGSVFSTQTAGKQTVNGKTNYYFKFTGKKNGSAGIYVTVGKKNYRVFTATSAGQGNNSNGTTVGGNATIKVSDSLNLRAQPNSNGNIIGQLSNGEKVTVLEDVASGWVKIKTAAGLTGYCCSDYVQLDSSKPANNNSKTDTPQAAVVKVSSGTLNFRSAPSTSSTVIGQLSNGQSVTVLDAANGWSHIQTTDGVKGYCSSDYLVAGNSGNSEETIGASKTLSGLPSFKQKDSLWANTYIGGSNGGTIGTIGCLVTCVAMTESYRTSSTVTPNDIKTQCQFTDGGGLYWPENYTEMSGVSDSNLAKVFQQLKADKPVIVGGANSQSPHWVVIKGYKNVPLDSSGNPTSLDASMFLVNDPGYDNYTLADYISQFPSGRVFRTY